MGKSPDHVLFRRGIDGARYDQNAGLDKDGDGAITVADATAPVASIVASATGRIEVPASSATSRVASAAGDASAILGLLALIVGIHSFKRLGRLKT